MTIKNMFMNNEYIEIDGKNFFSNNKKNTKFSNYQIKGLK